MTGVFVYFYFFSYRSQVCTTGIQQMLNKYFLNEYMNGLAPNRTTSKGCNQDQNLRCLNLGSALLIITPFLSLLGMIYLGQSQLVYCSHPMSSTTTLHACKRKTFLVKTKNSPRIEQKSVLRRITRCARMITKRNPAHFLEYHHSNYAHKQLQLTLKYTFFSQLLS